MCGEVSHGWPAGQSSSQLITARCHPGEEVYFTVSPPYPRARLNLPAAARQPGNPLGYPIGTGEPAPPRHCMLLSLPPRIGRVRDGVGKSEKRLTGGGGLEKAREDPGGTPGNAPAMSD